MIDILILFESVALLLLMIIPGFLMSKFKLAPEKIGKGISNLILYITQPALIIHAYVREYDHEVMMRAIMVFILSVVAHLIFTLFAFLLYKKQSADVAKILRFATIFTNAGYMGIPLICSVLGDSAAIYASIYVITFNVFVWTVGCFIFTENKKYISLKKAILNPATISTIVGIIIFVSPINTLPTIFMKFLVSFKDMVAPLSMIIIGLQLANMKLKGAFKDIVMYKFIFLRMLILPAIVWVFLKIVSLCGYTDATVMTVILLCAATPVATATSMFAEIFDGNTSYAGKLVSVTTIISLITMPIISLLLNI